jgi:histidyl-tRNA synthetase
MPKIGQLAVANEMMKVDGVDSEVANVIISLAEISAKSADNAETLDKVSELIGAASTARDDNAQTAEHSRLLVQSGVRQLRELLDVARNVGIPNNRIRADLSICRGLDYYTGTIYETFLTDLPGIGSVCSGGRYDNLAALYTKQALPGVGASLGLDRLLAAMEELNLLPKASTPAPVLVVQFSADRLGDYQRLARELRAAGIATEVYPDAKKIGPQLQYAERRGFTLALIAGPDEFAAGMCKLKVLASREERTVPRTELVSAVSALVAGAAK